MFMTHLDEALANLNIIVGNFREFMSLSTFGFKLPETACCHHPASSFMMKIPAVTKCIIKHVSNF